MSTKPSPDPASTSALSRSCSVCGNALPEGSGRPQLTCSRRCKGFRDGLIKKIQARRSWILLWQEELRQGRVSALDAEHQVALIETEITKLLSGLR